MFRFTRVSKQLNVVARSFSASHEPPKKLFGHTGRYAMATYTAASKAGALEKVETELLSFAEVVKKNANLSAFLGNPTIPRQEKTNKVSQLFDETKFSSITRNLFLTLSANGRLGESLKIVDGYSELMQANRGVVNVTIISAEELKKKQLESVQQALGKFIGAGKKVEINTKINPSILSGLQVLVGDKFLDLSVSSRINDISKSLDAAL
jgi:F-type H+-transporting ATPase subunit O